MTRRPLAPPALSGPRFNEFITSQKEPVNDGDRYMRKILEVIRSA